MSYSGRLYDLAQMNQIAYILSILYNKVGNLKKRDEAANLFLLTQKELKARESQTQFVENEILEPQMLISAGETGAQQPSECDAGLGCRAKFLVPLKPAKKSFCAATLAAKLASSSDYESKA